MEIDILVSLRGISLVRTALLYYILFLKNGVKNYRNHLRTDKYEICTTVAHCFPNISDAIVFENINLFEDKIGRPPIVIK
jgi:hypothetical protein